MKKFQRLIEGRLEKLDSTVLLALEFSDIPRQFSRKKYNDRVGEQDKDRQFPVDQKQYHCGKNQSEDRNNKLAHRCPDETIYRIDIRH